KESGVDEPEVGKPELDKLVLDKLENLFSASMESLSPQVVSAAKLLILNPNEFDLWKMMIEHTNESVSAVASVSAASAKVPVSALPNVDTLSDVAIYSFFARKNLRANGTTSIGFDMSKVECYNCDRRGYFARECSYVWSFQAEEEPTNYALMAFTSLSSSSSDNVIASCSKACTKAYATLHSESDVSMPASPVYDRYQSREGYHSVPPPYTRTFMPPKPDLVFHDAPIVNETVHTAFNVMLSPTKPDKDLSYMPSAYIIEDWVSDSKNEAENAPSFVQPTEQVKTLRPSVNPVEHPILAANHKTTIPKPKTHGNSRNRKACFVLLTKSKLVPLTTARPVTTDVPQPHVTRPRPAKTIVTKPHSPPRRNINSRPSPKSSNFPPKVTTVKALKVNDVKGVQGNW
nr:hypothetical protein [Tanacetum cinerariifolium]